MFGSEIERNTGAEGDRHPRQQTAGAGLGARPFAKLVEKGWPRAKTRRRKAARLRCAPRRPGSRNTLRPAGSPAPLCHSPYPTPHFTRHATLACQAGKTGTEAEFPGKAAILVKAQLSSNACEPAVLLKAASRGLDAIARKPWRSPPEQESPSVTGPELKQLRQDLGDAIGRSLSAADMAKLCGLEGRDGADTVRRWEVTGPSGPAGKLLHILAMASDRHPILENFNVFDRWDVDEKDRPARREAFREKMRDEIRERLA
jgi:DNA-binding transcriptional regulator YiaG